MTVLPLSSGSPAGKTSFINVIGGLTKPQKGRIELNGHTLVNIEKRICLPPEKRKIGYVFQDARLFPHYRIRGNLRYGMARGWKISLTVLWNCWVSGIC